MTESATRPKRDFDAAAARWDANPMRVQLATATYRAIAAAVPLTPTMRALDFGCGTGLLTFLLHPHVGTITGADSSAGMLATFREKALTFGLDDVATLHVDPEQGDTLGGPYDLIVSNMTLHHIADPAALIRLLYAHLAPGGHLCLADLDLDDGEFHADNTGVHHFGFERGALQQMFVDAGFTAVNDVTATAITRTTARGVERTFTIFMMHGVASQTE